MNHLKAERYGFVAFLMNGSTRYYRFDIDSVNTTSLTCRGKWSNGPKYKHIALSSLLIYEDLDLDGLRLVYGVDKDGNNFFYSTKFDNLLRGEYPLYI